MANPTAFGRRSFLGLLIAAPADPTPRPKLARDRIGPQVEAEILRTARESFRQCAAWETAWRKAALEPVE